MPRLTGLYPGFEPTHLCDPSDKMTPYIAGLADCATATQSNLRCEKKLQVMHEVRDKLVTFRLVLIYYSG